MNNKPKAEANRISHILNHFYGRDRFPVDVEQLARDYSKQISPESYITDIKSVPLDGFEGCLKAKPDGSKWMIAYNPEQGSPGRTRFTLAHELGHFVLHRNLQQAFECSERDLYDWDSPVRQMEAEADTFASYLLMPLDDFRAQLTSQSMNVDLLDHCCNRYGVSPMAAALKWVEIAPRRTVVVAARDGFLLWARSNGRAYKSGRYFATSKNTVEVPSQSLLAEVAQNGGADRRTTDARIWFPQEPYGMPMEETAICVDNPSFPYILGILQMPEAERDWATNSEDEETLRPLTGLQW
ncbi:ImmA/IrrE family metallo-endopeptidase [Microbulbifer litoralis]|uniref:ImmA/IrrE family metallo-endopeptidase n=1 Tax=Microbulbifer litoralis TaxID=2933965 RepID=UPI0020295163|nr:ImmA/IrrE family metallo-endopeptidase [Microbulbifer sp. GX H0434]